MAGYLIDAGEVEEIVPVLLDMLLEHNLITEEQVDQIMQADSFLFDTNAHIFSTPKTRGLLFSHEEYLILEADTTKVVDGKYPLDYANEIIESNLDDIIDYIVQSGTETYNDRTSRGFGNRWKT